ncbi:endonuclease/exonuclease/phosphatase family protein [Phaeovulum sp. NW3]|nr:endonuclease/exonuclease/phosphatase family protein [Phaeovulum sp. NW3]
MAETLRIATFNADLNRRGPGLLLRDIRSGKDAQVEAVVTVIASAGADVIVLTGMDWDHDALALQALAARLSERGAGYSHLFTARPNTGMSTGLDLDGNGRLGEARDAQGYGRFTGEGGMAVLSRLPILDDRLRDFSALLWDDLPDALIDGAGLAPPARAVQRLSSTAHWDLPLALPGGGALHLWAYHATPPVFDGPEDRNGRRNHDETALWLRYLEGRLPQVPADAPFVILGDANLDPEKGEGRHEALRALLAHPAVQDPLAGLPTVDWPDTGPRRVDYVLPAAELQVTGAGVLWSTEGLLAGAVAKASRHRLVWVDVTLP